MDTVIKIAKKRGPKPSQVETKVIFKRVPVDKYDEAKHALELVLKGGKAEPSFSITHVQPSGLKGQETPLPEALAKYPVQTVAGDMKWYVPQQKLEDLTKTHQALKEEFDKLQTELDKANGTIEWYKKARENWMMADPDTKVAHLAKELYARKGTNTKSEYDQT